MASRVGLGGILLLACAIVIVLTPIAVAEEWPADELSRRAIARNQKTLARVKPCALEMTWKRNPAEPKLSTAVWKFNGTSIFTDWKRDGDEGPLGSRIRTVRNNAYFAFTDGDRSREAYQLDSDGGAISTANIQRAMQNRLPLNPLTFAFGNGSRMLSEEMDGTRYSTSFACAAEETTDDSGRRIVRMRIYPKDDSNSASARWAYDFDPACGYAITRMALLTATSTYIEYQVQLQPGERPGTWLPRHIWRRSYKNGEGQELDIRILPDADLSDAAFRLAALNLPANQLLVRTLADGSVTSNRMVDGVWEPFQPGGLQAPSLRSAPGVGAMGSKLPAVVVAALFLIAISVVLASKRAAHRRFEN
jgi:hypothetical protein